MYPKIGENEENNMTLRLKCQVLVFEDHIFKELNLSKHVSSDEKKDYMSGLTIFTVFLHIHDQSSLLQHVCLTAIQLRLNEMNILH